MSTYIPSFLNAGRKLQSAMSSVACATKRASNATASFTTRSVHATRLAGQSFAAGMRAERAEREALIDGLSKVSELIEEGKLIVDETNTVRVPPKRTRRKG